MTVRNYAVLVGLFVLAPDSSTASTFAVGSFTAARGGFESLAPGEDSSLANDIASAFPGTTFQFTNTLATSFLNSVNVVILGVATTDSTAITPLSASEQAALLNFVDSGGTALIFSDNSTFDSDAPAANASLLSPFGVTTTGTVIANAPILNLTGPLTGPFTPVTEFATNFAGYYTNTGGGTVLADLSGNPAEPAIDYFAPGSLSAGSGAVVLFSDSDAMVAGDSLTATNLNLMLNAFALTGTAPVTTTPEPNTLLLFGIALGGLIAIRHRKAA